MNPVENADLLPAVAAAATMPARLLVCERTGRWALALRRELAGSGVRVWETRVLADCWQELAASPASFVVLELGSNAAELLRRLLDHAREFPMSRVAVVADRSLAGYEWLMREAGAIHFLASTRDVGPMAQLACRHLAQAPTPPQSLAERIWGSLPWATRVES